MSNRNDLVAMLDSLTVAQAQNLINRSATIAAKGAYAQANLAALNDLAADVHQIASDLATVGKYLAASILLDRGTDAAPPQ